MINFRTAAHILFGTIGFCIPSVVMSDEVDELNHLLDSFAEKQEEITHPFAESRAGLRAKYAAMLKPILTEATQQGDLNKALMAKNEIEGLSSVKLNKLPKDASSDLSRLREIYDTECTKIDTQESLELSKLLPLMIQSLDDLEIALTKDSRLSDAVIVRTVKIRFQNEAAKSSATIISSPAETISRSELELRREKGGKLRIEGAFVPGVSAYPPMLDELPSDFVSVFAFRTCWVALRENGKSLVVGLNREKTAVESSDTLNVKLVGKGYDPFIYTQDKLLHRIVNWEINHSTTIRNPIALAGGHSTALLINSRGDPELRGGTSVAIPPDDFREDIKDLFSTKHTFLTLNESGTGRIWNMREGREMKLPEVESINIGRVEGGDNHYLVEDIDGKIRVIDVTGSSALLQIAPGFAHSSHELRAGGSMNAVQIADGTWRAWGKNEAMTEIVAGVGMATDLDLYWGEMASYAIWIEPTTN